MVSSDLSGDARAAHTATDAADPSPPLLFLPDLAHPSHSAGPSSFACQPRAELLHLCLDNCNVKREDMRSRSIHDSPVHVPMSIWYDGKTSCQSATKLYEIPFILAFHIGLPHPGPAPGDTTAGPRPVLGREVGAVGGCWRNKFDDRPEVRRSDRTYRIVACTALKTASAFRQPLFTALNCRTPTPNLRLR